MKQLYIDIKDQLYDKGIDMVQTGGSNGRTTFSNGNILKFLTTPAAFTRKGKGVKLIKRDHLWTCYYLAADKGTSETNDFSVFTSWKYAQPQIGGSFNTTGEFLENLDEVVLVKHDLTA